MQLANFTSNFLKFFFGENGDNQYPPEDADPTGLVSWEQGYPSKYSDDPLQNGLYILRQKMNGIFGTLSKEIKYQQLFQSRFFDDKVVSLGGYPRGASCFVWQDQSTLRLVQNPSNNVFVVPVRVISMKDDNTTSPYSAGALNKDWWLDDGRAIGGIYISDVNLNTPPDGYLDIGSTTAQQIFNKNDYPRIKALLDANGGNWGYFKNYPGNPTDQFELINRRGYFHRTWSNGSSIDSARQFQTLQNDAIRNIKGRFWGTGIADGVPEGDGAFFRDDSNPVNLYWGTRYTQQSNQAMTLDASRTVSTANENRPYNANEKRYVKV